MADTNSSSAASTPSSAASSSKIATSMYASSTTPATKPTSAAKTVTLKEGDKLWRVATDAGISLDTLVQINGLKDYSVKPGKVLQLP